jgi:GAF domain-containing protein
MGSARWQRFLELIEAEPDDLSEAAKICAVASSLLDGHSSSIGVVVDGFYSAIAAAGDLAVVMDEAQFQIGDGPVFDVQRSNIPIVIGDTLSHSTAERYPALTEVTAANQIRSLAAFPLRAGVESIGSLTVYREIPGELSADQFADGLVAASFALAEIVNSRAGVIGVDRALGFQPNQFGSSHLQIAAGMVAEALGCSIVESLVRIRAHAFAVGEPVSVVARRITEREFMLKP